MNKKTTLRLRSGQPSARFLRFSGLAGRLGATAVSVGLLLTLVGCAVPGGEEVPSEDRLAAPTFDLETVSGGSVGTDEIAGKVVLLDFWATWCAPCHVQTEILEEIYQELRDSGVGSGDFEILSIDTGEEPKRVTAFLQKNPASYPVLMDIEGTVGDEFEVVALPTVVLLDRQGRIAFRATGITEAKELRPQILKELEAADEVAS